MFVTARHYCVDKLIRCGAGAARHRSDIAPFTQITAKLHRLVIIARGKLSDLRVRGGFDTWDHWGYKKVVTYDAQ